VDVEGRASNVERRKSRRWVERSVRFATFMLALVPLARIAVQALNGGLGGNPIEEALHRTGWWALTFLILTLSVTPVRRLTGIGWLIKFRRMLGLYAFFYAVVHFAVYVGIDQYFAWEYILEDIRERPYITVGFTALLILVPLAATSTKRMIRRLGGRRWNRLHRLVYVAAALGVLHFLWLVKADTREPLIFGAVLATLLGYRLVAGQFRKLASLKWPGIRGVGESGVRGVADRGT
jgi:sulfoxide reductase heme-binding subunit YedZ